MNGPDPRYGGVTVLTSPDGGRYPSATSLLISGTESTVLVDPSLEVDRRGRLGPDIGLGADIDLVAVTHAHEDHVAGLHLFPEVPVVVHSAEAAAVRDPEMLLAGFGLADAQAGEFRRQLRETFHVSGHRRVDTVDDGAVIDLGRRSVTVVHLPGHTAGHCGFVVEPDGFLFLGDIDLTSFGPYYGDLSSSLDDFVTSIERLRDVDARWYGTSHQVGVLDDRQSFLSALDRFASVIERRDETLLQLLRQPRALDEIVAHRLVYRPHVRLPFVDAVERRTAVLHLERLQRAGLVVRTDAGYLAV